MQALKRVCAKRTKEKTSDNKRKRQVLLFPLALALFDNAINFVSVQSEVDFQRHGHGDRCTVLFARLKQPCPDFLQRLLVQSHAQAADDFQVVRLPIGTDDR